MAEQKNTFPKKINQVKLLLSSLFARKLNYLIVNGRKPGTIFFTSIEPERALFYKPDIDDQLSRVVLSDKAKEVLYEIFPVFKDNIAAFFLPKFLSLMNKKLQVEKGVAPVPLVNAETSDITFKIPEGMTAEELFKTPKDRVKFQRGKDECFVGQLITEDNFNRYDQIVNGFLDFGPDPTEREITIAEAYAKDKVVLVGVELHNTMRNCDVEFRLPIQDGTNIVSFKEYLSKKKVPWKYRAVIRYNEQHSTAKVAYCYADDMVDVVSTTPGSLWFPFRKRS